MKRRIEIQIQRNCKIIRQTRGANPDTSTARTFLYLREKGQPGDVGVIYDLDKGKLIAEIKVSVARLRLHRFNT